MSYHSQLKDAVKHLRTHDPVLAPVIERSGVPDIEPHNDYFRALASSIVGQQLSVKAAATIRNRFIELGSGSFPTPDEALTFSDEQLREAGLSGAKAKYIRDLATHVLDRRLDLAKVAELPNAELITELTDVKGVGEWTAHMFLIFCVGRLDVLPVGDLGVRKGMQLLYELEDLPTPVQMMAVAERHNWTGYESIASWYMWEVLDNKPDLTGG